MGISVITAATTVPLEHSQLVMVALPADVTTLLCGLVAWSDLLVGVDSVIMGEQCVNLWYKGGDTLSNTARSLSKNVQSQN